MIAINFSNIFDDFEEFGRGIKTAKNFDKGLSRDKCQEEENVNERNDFSFPISCYNILSISSQPIQHSSPGTFIYFIEEFFVSLSPQ